MNEDLASFLATMEPFASEDVEWRGGQLRLELRCYLTSAAPPDALITSARCIILAGDKVLVLINPDGEHITPGGRREPGESPQEAVIREVREETGLEISVDTHVIVMHFHHTTPIPPLYDYPYPDFLQVVFLVRLDQPAVVSVADTYELGGAFVPIAELEHHQLPPHQRDILHILAAEHQATMA